MIYITFKGTEYEIPYNKDTVELQLAIDGTFDRGFFKSEPLQASTGLDFSRRIPRGLLVRYEYNNRTFYFKTGETYIDKVTYFPEEYVHEVNLISLTKDLTFKPLENMTVTQPKGDLGLYNYSENKLYDYSVLGTYTELSLINTVETNTSKIDDTEINELNTYRLTVDFNAGNQSSVNNEILYIRIKFNGTVLTEQSYSMPMKVSSGLFGSVEVPVIKSFTYTHVPTVVGTYTVEAYASAINTPLTDIHELTFSISSRETTNKPIRTYASLVDKILRNTDYVLSANSRSRLELTAPEAKYEGYTIYDALQKIAGELRALVKVGDLIAKRYWELTSTTTPDYEEESLYDISPYEVNVGDTLKVGLKYYKCKEIGETVREINFMFFDNPSTINPIGEIYRTEQAELEDNVSALELNTQNVIKPIRYSPHRNGWGSLRNIDGIGQMTTGNIGYQTEDKIERMIKVVVKGFPSVNYSVTDETDISSRIVEKKQWDTLPSEANRTEGGKSVLRKNNTLYYIQGDDKLYGMEYIGEQESTQIGTQPNCRALYETILTVRTEEQGSLETRTGNTAIDDPATDGTLNGDLAIRIQVTYENITQSRARVYKDDLSGFEDERVKYMNESANVNDTNAIGSYAQQLINKLGGTLITVQGVCDDWSEIANVGDIDSQGRVYTLITLKPSTRINYTYVLVQDYNVISSYIGVNSRHRVEEISSDSTTLRTLRYTSKLIFTENQETFTSRMIQPDKIVKVLTNEGGNAITYGYLECNLVNENKKKLHLSIDSDSKGKTIELKWRMKNNYSAGLKRYMEVISSTDVWLNSDVQYTDLYGQVSDIYFGLYFDNLNSYDQNLYPEAENNVGTDALTIITDFVDKDAGEVLSGLVEIPIISENENIRIYDGFAKYNGLVEGTKTIKVGVLQYTPMKNAIKVDTKRIVDIEISAIYEYGVIKLSGTATTNGQGIVFYNKDTLDMLMVIHDYITIGLNEFELYYKLDDSRAGGVNYGMVLTTSYNIGSVLTISDIFNGYQITENIGLETDVFIKEVQWVNISTPSGIDYLPQNDSCEVIGDLLNIDCELNVLSCSWAEGVTFVVSGNPEDWEVNAGRTCTEVLEEAENPLYDQGKTECIIHPTIPGYLLCTQYQTSAESYEWINCKECRSITDTTVEHDDTISMTYAIDDIVATSPIFTGYSITETINIITDVDIATDDYELEYRIDDVVTISDILSGYQITRNIGVQAITGVVDWQTGGTTPTTNQKCEVLADLASVKCDVIGSTCTFEAGQGYLSGTDLTTTEPTCQQDATYTVCTFNGTNWSCVDYTGQVENEYGNCLICNIIEV